ncbi:MAG TPA: transcription termination/antitermination NusG family protein [Dissulfurispiraceae bacterium]
MNWYAIYTKPKQEDRVEENLSRASIEVFNPRLKRKKLIRGKYEQVIQPFFPCYLFARFEPAFQYHMIKYTRGVRGVIGTPGSPWPVSEEMIDIIRSRMNEDGVIVIRQDIKAGDNVEITEGPFAGFVGIFEREMKDKDRVIVLLNTIEYQVRIEVEQEVLRKR